MPRPSFRSEAGYFACFLAGILLCAWLATFIFGRIARQIDATEAAEQCKTAYLRGFSCDTDAIVASFHEATFTPLMIAGIIGGFSLGGFMVVFALRRALSARLSHPD
ncbi:MAG: hypothetical protein SNJ73_00050 [Acetobacteraceae bacterium]